MARKRAPGAGRKPRGEFKGKSATLTTRIMPETRAAMQRAAQKSGRSLSQEVERRLNDSVLNDRNRRSDVRALVEAIAIVSEKVEIATGKLSGTVSRFWYVISPRMARVHQMSRRPREECSPRPEREIAVRAALAKLRHLRSSL
jgi:hypothetical protein